MIINHNIAALNTHRQMGQAQSAQMENMGKLSSGMRINSAKDDAAGLTISEKMRGQIRGLEQGSRNAQDGISLIQTAEGALSETQDILQRMRELSVQSANDTNTADDRAEIQKEIDQLTQEVDRIGSDTEFNSKKLLNGGAGIKGTSTNSDITIVSGTADTKVVNGGSLTFTGATTSTAATSSVTLEAGSTGEFTINGHTFSLSGGGTVTENGDEFAKIINDNADILGVKAVNTTGTVTLTSTAKGAASNIKLESAANNLTTGVVSVDQSGANATAGGALGGSAAAGATTSSQGNIITVHGGEYDGLQVEIKADGNATLNVTDNGVLSMQIGANEGQDMSISIGDMRSSAIGIAALDMTTSNSAKEAISTIDDAIKQVSGERSKMGAYQNRLEHTINNLNVSSENLTAAESRIRDVDYTEAA